MTTTPPMTAPPRLEVRNLVRRFDGRTVVDDVTLTINRPEVREDGTIEVPKS